MSERWAYKVDDVTARVPTIMRWRSDPAVQIEITNSQVGHWKRIDDLLYTFWGIETDNWYPCEESHAREIGLPWFDEPSTETIPVGSRPWPEADYGQGAPPAEG